MREDYSCEKLAEKRSVLKTLLIGHDCIEWGWTIAAWVPYCRFMSQRYEKTIVVCRKANKYLYEDFADNFIYYDKRGETDRWLFNRKKIKMPKSIKIKGASVRTPNRERCMSKAKKKYLQYGELTKNSGFDILIHARARKQGQTQVNWPTRKYVKMMENFPKMTVASIGTKEDAYCIPGTTDLRGTCLKNLCNIMRSSKIVVGTSSGPLHLASHCGTPHVVITSNEYRKCIKGTNRYRYTSLWNPFKTPVEVIDKYGWNAPVEPVVKAVGKYL